MARNRECWSESVTALCAYWREEKYDDDDIYLFSPLLNCPSHWTVSGPLSILSEHATKSYQGTFKFNQSQTLESKNKDKEKHLQ